MIIWNCVIATIVAIAAIFVAFKTQSMIIGLIIWITCILLLTEVSAIIEYEVVKQEPAIEFSGTVIKKGSKGNSEDRKKLNIVVESKEGKRIIVKEMCPKTTEDVKLCVVGDKIKIKYVELKELHFGLLHWKPKNTIIIVTDFQIK